MGKATGFLEFPRTENPYRDAERRTGDYGELHTFLPAEERRRQACRCMDCGVPFCQSDFGCPLHNLIPEWNDLLYRGLEREALGRLLRTAPFPEFTGRVCPALCEKACNLAEDGVTNRDNELYLIETGFAEGWIRPRPVPERTGKKAAVIGSGPAGLAAADRLNRLGHEVTVLEKADRPGGLLMYGIPAMKLPKAVVERRIRLMEAEGITFRMNTEAEPREMGGYDAVLLCGGAKKPRALKLENGNAEGILFAVDYLTENTKSLLENREPAVTARGKRVIVVGGGDTGNDCVGTALRQGCAGVTQIEMMPEAPRQRGAGNPWPEWPRTLRTDYGQLEAAALLGKDPRIYETTVKSVRTDGTGRLTAVETVKLRRDPQGRLQPEAGTEQMLECELMLIAAGFIGCEEQTLRQFGLEADSRGRLMPEDGSHYLGGKLFSAGDMRTGQSLVVRALADGRKAAEEADAWLRRKGS